MFSSHSECRHSPSLSDINVTGGWVLQINSLPFLLVFLTGDMLHFFSFFFTQLNIFLTVSLHNLNIQKITPGPLTALAVKGRHSDLN